MLSREASETSDLKMMLRAIQDKLTQDRVQQALKKNSLQDLVNRLIKTVRVIRLKTISREVKFRI